MTTVQLPGIAPATLATSNAQDPAVSIVMPFEPKMTPIPDLGRSIAEMIREVESQILPVYPPATVQSVLARLRGIFSRLNYETYKKGLMLYTAPGIDKVLYLDIPVEKRITVDKPFDINEALRSKREQHKYLLLVVYANESHLYLGNYTVLLRLVSLSRFGPRPGIVSLEDFFKKVDNTLSLLLDAYQMPLMVVSDSDVLPLFSRFTRHYREIIHFIEDDLRPVSTNDLSELLSLYVSDWATVREAYFLQLLDRANQRGRLVFGIDDVLRGSRRPRKHLLLIEKNFIYAIRGNPSSDASQEYAVNSLMESVLENGGDIEFMDPGSLEPFRHVALINL